MEENKHMRLPDPFTDSNAPGFYSVDITSKSTILQDILPNSRILQVDQNQHSWGITINYQDLTKEEYLMLTHFLRKTRRVNSTIEVLIPDYQNYGFKPDSLSVKPGLSGNTIVLTNVNAIIGKLNYSTMIKLSNHNKLYSVLDYIYNPTTKELSLEIFPNLQTITVAGTTASFTGLLFTTRLSDPSSLVESFNPDDYTEEFSISLIESIN